ncbi:MAG: PAS domain S-box protein, partial [Candidatus Lokiarchaeota archaeon]|nr:PAS domain S-box protein [Candidatus Lokiarchaeota archaeon]
MMSIIQEYSNHLEEIFENSFEYMYLHDKKGNILDVNNIVVQNLGYSKNEILNMKVTDFLLEEVPSIISDEIKKTMETGVANKSRTYKVRKKDSTFIYVEVSAVPLKKNGEFYAILGIGHDVTAYKEVEQNLRESEEKFRRIFETIPDLFFLVSSDTTILDYKGNVKDFFVPPEKLINRKISEIVPEDIATISSNSIKKTIESHEPQIVEYELLIKGINRIFEARHLYFSQDRVLVFIREITKRKRSEQKLKEKNLELSVLNRIITLGNESTSLQEFLEKSYDQVLDIVSFNRGGVYLYNPETQHNNLVVHKNVHHDFIAAVEDVDISEGLFAKVFDKNKPFYIEDFSDFMEGSKELGIYSTAIIPLRSKDKYVGSM